MYKRILFLSVLVLVAMLTLTACQGFIRIREVDGGFDVDLDAQGDPDVLPPTGGDTIIQQQQDSQPTNEFIQSNWILILGILLVFTIVIVALTRRGETHIHKD